jgi:predicted AlkP superfamily phosphohydrolase/phosphomutase
MREVNGSELLEGSDHEFVVNLYTVILNRWPDEDGYRHHLQRVENRPDIRRQVIQDIAGSAEGRALGVVLRFADDAPAEAAADPAPAPAAGAGSAGAALAALLAGLGTVPDAELHALQRQLADALAAVTAERAARVEARLARLEQRLG